MSKREHNGTGDPLHAKRTRVSTPNLIHYPFSTDPESFRRYSWVVPRENFFGRSRIVELLQAEVATPLQTPEDFEVLSQSGVGYPLNRCLRVFGVPNSSKRTAVLAFAHDQRYDVLEVNSDFELDPALHFHKLFRQAVALCAPTLIVLRKFNRLFSNEVYNDSAAASENRERVKAAHYLAKELETLLNSRHRIWVLILSDTKPVVPYDVDKYFSATTYWNCAQLDPQFYDFYTDADRSMILTYLINSYNPCRDLFPMSTDDLVMFCFNHAKYCTFRQLREFIRSVFTQMRYSKGKFAKDTLQNFIKERNMVSISLYDAHAVNILGFL